MNQEKLDYLIASLDIAMKTDKDSEQPFTLVQDIRDLNDFKSIPYLLRFLSDDSDNLDLMWSIIHAIEIFDDPIYIEKVLMSSKFLAKQSPEWGSLIFMRIINSDASKLELMRQLKNSPIEIKYSVKEIMELINSENFDFLAKTTPIIVAAST